MGKKIVEVIWEDIVSDSRWLSKKKRKKFKCAVVKSYGILESRGKKYLKLNHSICGNDADITVIPKSVVLKIRELETK